MIYGGICGAAESVNANGGHSVAFLMEMQFAHRSVWLSIIEEEFKCHRGCGSVRCIWKPVNGNCDRKCWPPSHPVVCLKFLRCWKCATMVRPLLKFNRIDQNLLIIILMVLFLGYLMSVFQINVNIWEMSLTKKEGWPLTSDLTLGEVGLKAVLSGFAKKWGKQLPNNITQMPANSCCMVICRLSSRGLTEHTSAQPVRNSSIFFWLKSHL